MLEYKTRKAGQKVLLLMLFTSFFLFLYLPLSLPAQQCKCKGVVYDGDTPANPLEGVEVKAVNGKGKAFTNRKGEFKITVKGVSTCNDVKVRVTAETLNGITFTKEEKLGTGTPTKIVLTDYKACICDVLSNRDQLYLHKPAKGKGKKHILSVRSTHRKKNRYIAEVKCLQKILDDLGYNSGKVVRHKKGVYKYKYKSNSVRKFISPKNKPGVYDYDEALAVWLFQSTALNPQSPDGQIAKIPTKTTTKYFGTVKITSQKVDKGTLDALNKANLVKKDWPWKWIKFKAIPNLLKRDPWRAEAEWGVKVLMDVLKKAAEDPAVKAKGGIVIGDLSLPTGGIVPGHGSHQRGVDVDIHLRDIAGNFGDVDCTWKNTNKKYKGKASGKTFSAYDQDYSEALLKALAAHPNVKYLFLHDRDFLRDGNKRSRITKGAGKIICAQEGKAGEDNYDAAKPCCLKSDSHTHHLHMRVVIEK